MPEVLLLKVLPRVSQPPLRGRGVGGGGGQQGLLKKTFKSFFYKKLANYYALHLVLHIKLLLLLELPLLLFPLAKPLLGYLWQKAIDLPIHTL